MTQRRIRCVKLFGSQPFYYQDRVTTREMVSVDMYPNAESGDEEGKKKICKRGMKKKKDFYRLKIILILLCWGIISNTHFIQACCARFCQLLKSTFTLTLICACQHVCEDVHGTRALI